MTLTPQERLMRFARMVENYGREAAGEEITPMSYPKFIPVWNEAIAVLHGNGPHDPSKDSERGITPSG